MFVGKSMARDDGISPSFTGRAPQCQEQNSPNFLSIQVTRPYKELLSDPLFLKNFSLEVLLMHKPLNFPNLGQGNPVLYDFPCSSDFLPTSFSNSVLISYHLEWAWWYRKILACLLTCYSCFCFSTESYGKSPVWQRPRVCRRVGLPQGRHPDGDRTEHRGAGRMVALLLTRPARHRPRQPCETPHRSPGTGQSSWPGYAQLRIDESALQPPKDLPSAKLACLGTGPCLPSAAFPPESGNLPDTHWSWSGGTRYLPGATLHAEVYWWSSCG